MLASPMAPTVDEGGGYTLLELQQKLQHNFRDSGVLNDITAWLRRRLVQDLQRSGLGLAGEGEYSVCRHPNQPLRLEDQLHLNLIADFLSAHDLQQSAAVFFPESGLTGEEGPGDSGDYGVKQHEDIMHGLGIRKNSNLFTAAMQELRRRREAGEGRASLLEALVSIMAKRSDGTALDSSCQTESSGPAHAEALALKLDEVHSQWKEKLHKERETPTRTLEEKMLNYQREVDARAKEEISRQVENFREKEMLALRLREAANRQSEVDQLRKELTSEFTARLDEVRSEGREQERMHKEKLRLVEQAAYEGRQKMMQEMDALRRREQDARRLQELQAQALKIEEVRLKNKDIALEGRFAEAEQRERQAIRVAESQLERGRFESRQTLEAYEESIKRERDFIKNEAAALRAEREACQGQLGAASAAQADLQRVKNEMLAASFKVTDLEGELKQANEQLAVYKEAYENG
ncbi:unnamed protein product, partial [Chrysoparadoxa australica]